MDIFVVGLNHEAPIKIREKAAFSPSQKLKFLQDLFREEILEAVILSTCNRSEIYFIPADPEKGPSRVRALLEDHGGCEIGAWVYEMRGSFAAAHLFRVACGLDSIVLGEDQIAGQVREAFEFALGLGACKKIFSRLFRGALETAKEMKNSTGISNLPTSISSIAVKYLATLLGSFKRQKFMLVGNGKMSRLALRYLYDAGANQVFLATRHQKEALGLLEIYPGLELVDYTERYDWLREMDVVISATGAPHPVFREGDFPLLAKPLVMMDLALPRDVEPEIGLMEGVCLLDLDALKKIQAEGVALRLKLAGAGEAIVRRRVAEFEKWLELSRLDQSLAALRDRSQAIRDSSLSFLDKRVDLDPVQREEVGKVLDFALQKILREPARVLKTMDDAGKRQDYVRVLEELFSLNGKGYHYEKRKV